MLELKNINVSFRSERQDKIFGHTRQQVLFDVSLTVKEGTCLGILGESGSGKSTMGRVLCGLLKPDSGEAVLDGVSVYASRAGRRNLQNKLSIVFQDYTTSANPRFRIRDIIGEGLTVQERREGKKLDRKAETSRLLELVGLPADLQTGFPMSFPADSCSVSASPAQWPASRKSFCLTKRFPRWMHTRRYRSWTCCGN